MTRLPPYYRRQQRWLFGFVAVVFGGMGLAGFAVACAKVLKEPGVLLREPGLVAMSVVFGLAFTLVGGWCGWLTWHWERWVERVARADRVFETVAPHSSIFDRVALSPFDLFRQRAGEPPRSTRRHADQSASTTTAGAVTWGRFCLAQVVFWIPAYAYFVGGFALFGLRPENVWVWGWMLLTFSTLAAGVATLYVMHRWSARPWLMGALLWGMNAGLNWIILHSWSFVLEGTAC